VNAVFEIGQAILTDIENDPAAADGRL